MVDGGAGSMDAVACKLCFEVERLTQLLTDADQ